MKQQSSSLAEQLQQLRVPSQLKESDFDSHIREVLCRNLSSVPPKALQEPDLLSALSPSLDTLPYLAVLNAQIHAASIKSSKPANLSTSLLQHAALLAQSANCIELRYAGDQWSTLIDALATSRPQPSPQSNETLNPLLLIATAMARLDPSMGTLTSSHITFVRACLRDQAYREALLVIESDIHSFAPKQAPEGFFPCSRHHLSNGYITLASKLTAELKLAEVQEYQLLCAMVYIGLRQWSSAQHHLEHVLATPTTNSTNGIMLEAYKKWLLVSLLADGKVGSLSKAANGSALKTLKTAAKPYEAIVEAFKLGNPRKLRAEIYEARTVLEDEANFGLAQAVVSQHHKLAIIRYADTCSAVSITELATQLGLGQDDKAAQYISSMVQEGLLKAEIEAPVGDKPSVVRFIQENATLDVAAEEQLRAELLAQAARIKILDSHVAEADHRLALTKEYAEHVRRVRLAKQEQKDAGTEDTGDVMDISAIAPMELGSEDESEMIDVQ